MESLNILHLSDFHFGNFKYPNPATLAIKIANTLSDNSKKVDVIIVSGDIYDGRSRDWEKDKENAINFFKVLIDKLKSKEICQKGFDEKSILFVPGNHDLIRDEDDGKQYEKYDAFIKEFYGRKRIKNRVVVDDYSFIYDFPEKKIAILGFNSCRIEIEREKDEDLRWINDIEFEEADTSKLDKIRTSIKRYKETQFTWDDFGYIDSVEMDNVFEALRKKIPAYTDYTLIATFHHHFYPFHTEVLDQFQRFNVKLVLHGHKHTPVQRAITDKRYFDNPDSIIYVLAAGSIGCRGVDNLSFHWLRVFDKNNTQLLEGKKYDFNDEESAGQKTIILPPRKNEGQLRASELKVMFQNEDPKLFQTYQELTDDFEQVIQDSDTEKIIQTIGKLYTVFPEIDKSLRKEPLKIYLILLAIHHRVILLKNNYEHSNNRLEDLLKRIEDEIITRIKSKSFSKNLINFLKATNNSRIEEAYSLIIKNVKSKHKEYGAYVSATLFLTDLFLNIGRYGEYYFKEEKLDLKINIKLNKDEFYDKLPSDSIEVKSDIDRRAIYIDFKCKNPTVHKIAVLIVKDFEMRLSKFEESLKTINLKLYYISPKVTPVNYDLENLHFNAYIPTLLPLLTGDNLYNQKEVFIRELVQNSIDATLLRQKLEPDNDFDTDINIEFGEEKRNGNLVKYFRITDKGIGMSKFTIERYFTSIGRSFYVSEEFKELKDDENISYNAISNFGIGFLSSFMVSTQVNVKTKNYMDSEGLEIGIPNHEGCFFINKIKRDEVGTEITLYEDYRKRFDFNEFEKYIRRTFQGIPLNINITGEKNFQIVSFKQQKDMLQSIKNNELIFYIPFSEETKSTVEIPWKSLINSKIDKLEKFGILFNFNKLYGSYNTRVITCNQGLFISKPFLPFQQIGELYPEIKINFPSSFIQLDVAREKISHVKKEICVDDIIHLLYTQALDFLTKPSKIRSNSYLIQTDILCYHMEDYNTYSKEFLQERYLLKTELKNKTIELSVVKAKEIPKKYDMKKNQYFSFTDSLSSPKIINFFENIDNLFYHYFLSMPEYNKNEAIWDLDVEQNMDNIMKIMEQELEVIMEQEAMKSRVVRKNREWIQTMEKEMSKRERKEIMKWERREFEGIVSEKTAGEDEEKRLTLNWRKHKREKAEATMIDTDFKLNKVMSAMEKNYAFLFFYASINFFIRSREKKYWSIYAFSIIKSYIFSNVKVSDASSFKCVIDFEKFGKALKEKYEEE